LGQKGFYTTRRQLSEEAGQQVCPDKGGERKRAGRGLTIQKGKLTVKIKSSC
jgi:hypothetical protein